MDSQGNNNSGPWFAVSMGLLGLIVGYALATGMNGSVAIGGNNGGGGTTPPPPAPAGRFATALEAFTAYAADIGINEDTFESCVSSGKHAQEVTADLSAGSAAGIDGTPGFWVLGPKGKTKKISGAFPFDTFKETFEAMLNDDPKFVSETTTPPTADDDPVLGQANAPITVIEFTDYQCPFCSRHFLQTFGQIKKEYVDTGKVKYVSRDYPLGFHPHAQKASESANCAGDQGKYWEMHDALFQNQEEWSGLQS